FPSIKSKWQMLEGWQVNSIVMVQSGEPYTLGDFDDDLSLTGEFNDRWNMTGPATNIHWSPTTHIPFVDPSDFVEDPSTFDVISGATPQAQLCVNQALAMGGQAAANLMGEDGGEFGCYVSKNTVITPPAYGTQGNMRRNIFRGPNFTNWDF